MAYKLTPLKCPQCGQNLNIEEGKKISYCSNCGTKLILSNENEYVYRDIDEAKVKQAETDQIIRLREMNLKEQIFANHKTLFKIWLIVTIILIITTLVLIIVKSNGNGSGVIDGMLFAFYICAPIIGGGGYFIFEWLPKKEKEKIMKEEGAIRFPNNLFHFEDMKYVPVRETLKSAGFKNITCINLQDMNFFSRITKKDKVTSIRVNGNEIKADEGYHMPDDPIVITYHGDKENLRK